MILKNGQIFTALGRFMPADVEIEGGRIAKIAPAGTLDGADVLDAAGRYVTPGFVDIHIHGAKGADFCDSVDGSEEYIRTMAAYLGSQGVTSFLGTTMAFSEEILTGIFNTARPLFGKEGMGAVLRGVNMEGPFISPVKKGAQDERNIMPCDTDICQRFLDASEGLVKFVGLAPEESEDAVAFVEAMKDKVNISLAHTNADYAHAKAAFDAGANHAVHLFNAMPAFTHREPGVVGAVSDSAHVMAEIICDGVHIHPSMVRAAFKMMGADRMILISDSMRATGMPDGQYTLGGLDVKVVGNHATLVSDGALAGSVTNLADCMRTVVKKMEIPLETAVACATINPAKSLGIEDTYGSIAPGKKANIVLLDENLELKMVIKDGQEL